MNATMILLVMAFAGAASTPRSLQEVLALTASSVQRFWSQLSSINCTETVLQQKLGERGKIQFAQNSSFDYLILMDLQGDDISVEESRVLRKESRKSSDLPLLLTTGFSTLQFVFHPHYQASFEYKRLDDEIIGGSGRMRVEFHHVRGMRSTTAVRLRGHDYPLDLTGTAWIDPDTGVICKIKAELEAPMEDLNLRALRAEVTYAPQHFTTDNKAQWLPAEALIDVETARQHWRNNHRFSDYRQFSVQSETKVSR